MCLINSIYILTHIHGAYTSGTTLCSQLDANSFTIFMSELNVEGAVEIKIKLYGNLHARASTHTHTHTHTNTHTHTHTHTHIYIYIYIYIYKDNISMN